MLDLFRQLGYPEIAPVPDGEHRPLWSVMIPTYNCAALLRETLESVLGQDPGADSMQIEVIDDSSTKDDPEAVVQELGKGRVAFHRHPKNVGATANFNACLLRSRGRLVQILHGDDLVLPGYYERMQDLLRKHPEAGSAFCRYIVIDDDGLWRGMNEPMQRRSGIYPDALHAIVSDNWGQFAAVVLRRSLVEAVGGFHPSLVHAADWDLWKRAALHGPRVY
jgi:glycosyltransferase involved in cell wall biosynthesis